MSASTNQLIAAVISGPILLWAFRSLWKRFADPKNKAEAHKIDVEADDLIVTRLWAEIDRLDRDLKFVRAEMETVKAAALDEKHALENENKRLRGEITRLKLRVDGLEGILRVKPLTPEDKAILAELDRKTGRRS